MDAANGGVIGGITLVEENRFAGKEMRGISKNQVTILEKENLFDF